MVLPLYTLFFYSYDMSFYQISIDAPANITFSFIEDGLPECIFQFFNKWKVAFHSHIHAYSIMPNSIHLLTSSQTSHDIHTCYKLIAKLEKNMLQHLCTFLTKEEVEHYRQHGIFKKQLFHHDPLSITEVTFPEEACDGVRGINFDPVSKKYSLLESPIDYVYSSIKNYITGNGMYPVETLKECKDTF